MKIFKQMRPIIEDHRDCSEEHFMKILRVYETHHIQATSDIHLEHAHIKMFSFFSCLLKYSVNIQ